MLALLNTKKNFRSNSFLKIKFKLLRMQLINYDPGFKSIIIIFASVFELIEFFCAYIAHKKPNVTKLVLGNK